ncbi:MAG TPA: glycogen/starch/alpha-glucan phosphorylase [Stellaceae bacterium]|jgi:starch phosphorylase|nr:glycogen/starch/alpha-glucan phosphorylase [Stellaceae bacterium]
MADPQFDSPVPPTGSPPSRDAAEFEAFKSSILAKLALTVGKDPSASTDRDWFVATAHAVRDRVLHRWLTAERQSRAKGQKRVYYLSLEFLIGRLLSDVLCNTGFGETARAALGDLGIDPRHLEEVEPDAALGNGGLGRLAACFMESMASLGISACGYGIRYDHGLFRQIIKDGYQQEYPENWLSFGNPWEFPRPELAYDIYFGGRVETIHDTGPVPRQIWLPEETIEAVPYDTPIVGWRGRNVIPLRLWTARAVDPMRLDVFNRGDHAGALVEQTRAESISKVLYPSDETQAGRELRLRQEYFFVSASLQDLLARHLKSDGNLRFLPDQAAIQLNDTHPSIAIAELMRLLVDVHGLPWDDAWSVTVNTFSYTNHTLLPEAIETWSISLFERMLPRHLQIIYRINAQLLEAARHKDTEGFAAQLAAISLIDEHGDRKIRMGHLAFVGSHRINGVSALHTELMRKTVFRDLHALYPDRIVNVTNGISFRRWLLQANPALTAILREQCGDRVQDDPALIAKLATAAGDPSVQQRINAAKRANKLALARLVTDRVGVPIDPDAMFDVQIKRIHEYKRQLLNVLDTVATYLAIRDKPSQHWTPRVKIFAGKAAASYAQAKLIIKLIHDVAKIVNADPVARECLQVVFLPDYNVSLAEAIIPAADLSEQISTAGMEASGTGNMKLALNGALTIGTLDGANIEIRDHVGAENIFIFGLKAHEVDEWRRRGLDAQATIAASPMLARALDAIDAGLFSPDDKTRFAPLTQALRHHDYYMVAADFDDYRTKRQQLDRLWLSSADWARVAIANIANMAWFSSDRAIAEYATGIWNVPYKSTAAEGNRSESSVHE